MRVIYKHHLEISGSTQEFPASEDAKILSVQVQKIGQGGLSTHRPTIWIEVDPEKLNSKIKFRVIMTGEWFNESEVDSYVGTFQQDWFVGHVYRLK